MRLKTEVEVLYKLSFDKDGGLSAKRVEAVCEYIDRMSDPLRKLRAYRAYAKLTASELMREKATIESAGKLSNESIEALKKIILRKNPAAKIEILKSPDLLGGVRISVGDEIVESSIRLTLEKLDGKF